MLPWRSFKDFFLHNLSRGALANRRYPHQCPLVTDDDPPGPVRKLYWEPAWKLCCCWHSPQLSSILSLCWWQKQGCRNKQPRRLATFPKPLCPLAHQERQASSPDGFFICSAYLSLLLGSGQLAMESRVPVGVLLYLLPIQSTKIDPRDLGEIFDSVRMFAV